MDDLDKIERGERVVSLDLEDEGAAGEVVETAGDHHVRVRWDDGHQTWAVPRTSLRREGSALTLDQLLDFEAQAVRSILPPALAQHFEAVVAAARREVIGRIARDELARSGDEMELRDRVAALVTIFLRDAIVLAGGAATVAAFDDVAIRRHFLGEVAALTETAMLALPDGALDSWSHTALRDAIGVVHIEAAACRVIARHEDMRGSWLKALSDAVRD